MGGTRRVGVLPEGRGAAGGEGKQGEGAVWGRGTRVSLPWGGCRGEIRVVGGEERGERQKMEGAEVGPGMETRNNLELEQNPLRGVGDTPARRREVGRERGAVGGQRVPPGAGRRRKEREGELRAPWGREAHLGLGCRAGGRTKPLEGRVEVWGGQRVREEVAEGPPRLPATFPTSSGSPAVFPPSPGANGTVSS